VSTLHRVSIATTARLHLGFLDMHGGLGRRFGSLGLSLQEPATRLTMERASHLEVIGPEAPRVEKLLSYLATEFGWQEPVRVQVESAIPSHAGLGSGTQLAMAVGMARSLLSEKPATLHQLANSLDRGNRSGIGIGTFQWGGFLVDGGRGPEDNPPPIISQLPFPEHWAVILIMDEAFVGIHGDAEKTAFAQLPRFSEAAAARLCHLTLMQVLPAVIEANLPVFGAAISEIQRTVGDHFAPAQGGRYTSPRVAQVLESLGAQGVSCLGQSSWGPTGFAVVESPSRAHELVQALQQSLPENSTLKMLVTHGRNAGAEISPLHRE
jgi:beta-RFAP synthase